MTAPLYAMVSTEIRRDLVAPLRHFTRLRLVLFYRRASYRDMTDADLTDNLRPYASPADLLRQLRQLRPDAVHGVEPFMLYHLPIQWALFLYARARGVPVVGDVHISRPLREKYGPLPARLLRLALWPITRNLRLVFYLNEGGHRNARAMGVPASRLVRHMYGTWGVDVDEFTPARDGREPDWGPGPVVLSVGRLHREKGIFDLLEAWAAVRGAWPAGRLVLVGDGPHRAEAEAWVQARDAQASVHFAGVVKHRELPPWFRAATLFVAPSTTTRKWEEYVGMTNIQAMASGVPVVSTLSGAIPEYVPDGVAGLLVPEQTPPALAAAMQRLLADAALRRQMGEAGRRLVLERYDARRNVERAEALILERCWPGRGRNA